MRWGFLGASRIGRRALAPALVEAGEALHAVAARDIGRAQEFARDFAAPRAYGDYAALLADPEIEAVYIALPNDAHAPWSIRALEAGKHVLCEKPLALNAAEVEAMLRAEQASGRRAMEAFCHVHHPQIARVKEQLRDGAIGRLVAMQIMFGIPVQETPGGFRWRAASGGGALYDLGCYCVSLMRVLAGEPGRATAMQQLRGEVDVTFSAQMDFGGATGQFTCSFDAVFWQEMVLVGTEGRMRLDWPISNKGREASIFSGDEVDRFAPLDPYARMVRHFARMAAGEAGLDYGLDWSLEQARAMDRLIMAARSP